MQVSYYYFCSLESVTLSTLIGLLVVCNSDLPLVALLTKHRSKTFCKHFFKNLLCVSFSLNS